MEQEKKTRKSKGEGSIQKLPNGKYKVQITIGTDANGKQQRKSVTCSSKTEAVAKKKQLEAELQKGTLVKANNCKLFEYITRWLCLKEAQTKKTTYESYVDTCNQHIIPTLGMHKVQKLTTAHINDYIAIKLKSGLAASSVQRHKAILHNILNLAGKEGIVGQNVVVHSNPIKKQGDKKRPLTEEEMGNVLVAARKMFEQDNGKGNRFYQLYHILMVALATGMRRGEIIALKWENIDDQNNTMAVKENVVEVKGGILIDTPKTENSLRTISVHPYVIQKLREIRSESEWVFHTRDGKLLTPSNVCRAYRKLLKDLGIKGTSFHDLRHTNATMAINAGQDAKLVSERLGHSDVQTTLRFYTHTSPERHREAAEQIGTMLFSECLTSA